MNLLLIAAGLLCCASYSFGADKEHACCTPDQWEGGEGGMTGYAGHRKRGRMGEYAYISYDYKNKRTAVFMDSVEGDKEYKFQIVTLHGDDGEEGKRYVVDLKTDKCWVKKVCCEMRQACVPGSAKKMGPYSLGLKGGFEVESFEVKKEWKRGSVFASVTVEFADKEKKVCIPVGETLSGSMKGVDFMEVIGFVDITAGIKNETVFDVPEQCDEQTESSLAIELERDHFILAV